MGKKKRDEMSSANVKKVLIGGYSIIGVLALTIFLILSTQGCNELQSHPGNNHADLRWTASGDNAYGGGPCAGYEIAFTTDSSLPMDGWTIINPQMTPRNPGDTEVYHLEGLLYEVENFIRIRAYDDADNYSPWSNTVSKYVEDVTPPGMIMDLEVIQ